MIYEDDIPPTPETTADFEGHEQPKDMHIIIELSNYLINLTKKGDNTNSLHEVSEDERETGLGYDSNSDANEVKGIDDKASLVQLFRLASIIDQDSNENIELTRIWFSLTRLLTILSM